MTRINVTQHDEYEGTSIAGWFNLDKATGYDEDTYWDGNNMASKATGSPHDHEKLYRTAQGRWVLHTWSAWQGVQDTWTFMEPDAARNWLIAQDNDEAVDEHFGPLEDERGPGRPEVGGAVHVRLGDLLPALDEWAKKQGVNRAQAIREAVSRLVA